MKALAVHAPSANLQEWDKMQNLWKKDCCRHAVMLNNPDFLPGNKARGCYLQWSEGKVMTGGIPT